MTQVECVGNARHVWNATGSFLTRRSIFMTEIFREYPQPRQINSAILKKLSHDAYPVHDGCFHLLSNLIVTDRFNFWCYILWWTARAWRKRIRL